MSNSTDFTSFDWLTTMGPATLTFFLVALLSYFCIRFNFVPTRLMWLFAIIGTVFYTIIGKMPKDMSPVAAWTMKGGIAAGIAVLGVLVAMVSHDKLFRVFAKWWPALAVLSADIDSNGEEPKKENKTNEN